MGNIKTLKAVVPRWDQNLFKSVAVPPNVDRPEAAIALDRLENGKLRKPKGVFVLVDMSVHNAKRKAALDAKKKLL